jgi:AbrB family looped-hinge helix DNA binding protein
MARSVMRKRGEITIPAEARRAVHLEEGDPVEVEVVDGMIVLRPQKVVDASQAWFWAPDWQERIRRSVEEVEAGRGERFAGSEDFLTSLGD